MIPGFLLALFPFLPLPRILFLISGIWSLDAKRLQETELGFVFLTFFFHPQCSKTTFLLCYGFFLPSFYLPEQQTLQLCMKFSLHCIR